MSRPKKSSTILERAEQRLASLNSIEKPLEFGEGISLSVYQTAIVDLRQQLAQYNTILSNADEARIKLQTLETSVNTLSERMLMGIAVLYGKDSTEYLKAGGVRRSDRRKYTRKPKEVAIGV